MLGLVCLVTLQVLTPLAVLAADPPLIRFGHGFAAEEQAWLMAARPDLWVRAALLNAGLVPDKDVKVIPIAFPAMGVAVRSDKVNLGTFVEPFYSAEIAKGGLRTLFTAVKAVGYDHELLDVWFGEKFLKAQPDAVRAFLADYVAVTRYYLANTAQAKRDLHKANFVRTPLEIYLKNADWKRDPDGRVDVASLKKLAVFMHEKLGWLEKLVNVDEMVDLGYLPK